MKIFEYAILFHPTQTKEQAERGECPPSVLVVDVARCVAKDAAQAQIIAARVIPEQYLDKLANVEVAIRPF